MKLSDNVIAHVAQIIQLAILTGTDVVDHMRMIVLLEEDGYLELDPEYSTISENNLQRMLDEASSMQNENVQD